MYDPHYKSRAWKLTMAALTVAVVVSVLLIAAFA